VVIDDHIKKSIKKEGISPHDEETVILDVEAEKEEGEMGIISNNSRLTNDVSPSDIIGDPR